MHKKGVIDRIENYVQIKKLGLLIKQRLIIEI